MKVTRKMISATHAETMKHGDVILSAELLTRIYEAMSACVDVREECDCKAADMPFGRCCKVNRDDILRIAREQGLPETEVEGVFRVNTDDLGRIIDAANNEGRGR